MSQLRGSIGPTRLLNAGTMTGTTVLTSTPIDLLNMRSGSFEISWTGTPNGSFVILGSNTNVNYNDIGVTIADAAGSADSRLVNFDTIGFRYLKVQYTNASSTGALTVWGMAKGAG